MNSHICFILLSLILLSSCEALSWLGAQFNGSTGSGGGSIGYGPSYGSGKAREWLEQNTSAPDMSCSGTMLEANEVKIAPGHNGPWKQEWTLGLMEDLDQYPYSQILEDGVFSKGWLDKTGCDAYPRLNKEQRKAYVIHVLSEVCRPESGYAPRLRYSECGGSSCWTNIGLCQMIKKTVNLPAYGCNLSSSGDLADPRKHLRCALLVLNQNMRRCGGSFPCSKTYWGPMRKPGKVSGMIANTRAHVDRLHPYCKEDNWRGLDRRAQRQVGQQSDNLKSGCKVVSDGERNFPSKGQNLDTIIQKDNSGEASQSL